MSNPLYCRVCELAEKAEKGTARGSMHPGLTISEREEAIALTLVDLRERWRNGVPGCSQDDIVTEPLRMDINKIHSPAQAAALARRRTLLQIVELLDARQDALPPAELLELVRTFCTTEAAAIEE